MVEVLNESACATRASVPRLLSSTSKRMRCRLSTTRSYRSVYSNIIGRNLSLDRSIVGCEGCCSRVHSDVQLEIPCRSTRLSLRPHIAGVPMGARTEFLFLSEPDCIDAGVLDVSRCIDVCEEVFG